MNDQHGLTSGEGNAPAEARQERRRAEFRLRVAYECRCPPHTEPAGPVFKFAVKLCRGDQRLAQEITQETAASAIAQYDRTGFDPNKASHAKDPLVSWLFKICHDRHADYVKHASQGGNYTEQHYSDASEAFLARQQITGADFEAGLDGDDISARYDPKANDNIYPELVPGCPIRDKDADTWVEQSSEESRKGADWRLVKKDTAEATVLAEMAEENAVERGMRRARGDKTPIDGGKLPEDDEVQHHRIEQRKALAHRDGAAQAEFHSDGEDIADVRGNSISEATRGSAATIKRDGYQRQFAWFRNQQRMELVGKPWEEVVNLRDEDGNLIGPHDDGLLGLHWSEPVDEEIHKAGLTHYTPAEFLFAPKEVHDRVKTLSPRAQERIERLMQPWRRPKFSAVENRLRDIAVDYITTKDPIVRQKRREQLAVLSPLTLFQADQIMRQVTGHTLEKKEADRRRAAAARAEARIKGQELPNTLAQRKCRRKKAAAAQRVFAEAAE